MPTLCVGDRIEPKLSYTSDVTCQPPRQSKCDKICDTDTTSRQGKVLIFKPKALSFYTTDFLYISISS